MKTKTESKGTNKPEQKFRAGSITATIWAKEVPSRDKKTMVTLYNTEIVKNYKDGEEWKKTNNFNKEDLIKVSVVLNKVVEFLYLNEEDTE